MAQKQMKSSRIFLDIDNYIYAYHLNKFLVIPVFPEAVDDTLQAQWQPTYPLARSAPIQSYASSGPRVVNFSFELHRDFMNQVNYQNSTMMLPKTDDYLDSFINCVQSLSVPTYTDASKMVNPPLVAIKIADQIFCKGIMQNATLQYRLPLVDTKNGQKYAIANLSFSVAETEAYDAQYIAQHGSFRGLSSSLERKIAALSGQQSALTLSDINTNTRQIYTRSTQ